MKKCHACITIPPVSTLFRHNWGNILSEGAILISKHTLFSKDILGHDKNLLCHRNLVTLRLLGHLLCQYKLHGTPWHTHPPTKAGFSIPRAGLASLLYRETTLFCFCSSSILDFKALSLFNGRKQLPFL